MIFFSYTRVVLRISFIPLIIIGIIGYMAVKYGNTLAEGLVHAMIALAIWFGATFGIAAGIVTGIVVMRRRHGLRVINRTARAVHTEKDIPVISYTLYPEAKHEIEGRDGQGVTIDGIPIDKYTKIRNNSRYGKR